MSLSKEGKSIFIAILILNAIGTVMIYSASAVYADKYYDDSFYFLKRQCLYLFIGLIAMISVSMIDVNWIKKRSKVILLISGALLLTVFLPFLGKSSGGAQRWVSLFGFTFQPVEIVKIAVAIYFSDYLSRKLKLIQLGSFAVFVPPMIVLGSLFVFLILQPDLGSIVFLFLTSSILFFLSGIRIRYVVFAILAAIPAFVFAVIQAPYRVARVVSFLNPWADPQGSGFQIIQSFLSFGLGGVTGVGLGESVQKLFYLPQSYTDFIFSIVGEELGLLGTLSVLSVFVFLLIQGSKIVLRQEEPFRKLLSSAVVIMVSLQSIINMLVSIGMIPTKGLPLPFISYGGSSLICSMMAMGLLLAIDKQSQKEVNVVPVEDWIG